MATDKKISQLPAATLPIATGVKFEAIQGGINVQVDADDMPGSGGTSIPYGVTSGTNTYTIAATPAVTAYTDGMLLHIRVGNSSTSLVTLNFDSVGAKKLFDTAGTQAQDGYLKAGVDYLIVYNAALDSAAGGFTVVNELAGSKVIGFAVSDEVTPITSGTGKMSFRMPHAMTLSAVRASLVTAQASGSIFTVDINESGTTILSTKITIDNTETTSTTAATPAVISDTALADDAIISVDVDQVGNGSAAGLKIWLIGS